MKSNLILALAILALAATNAVTAGRKRWLVVAYWSAVSLYWICVTGWIK